MARHSIAIVDDDAGFLEQMRERFEGAGYSVRTFSSPQSAYVVLRSRPPSAVIIGLRFPDCQPGIDLATALKLNKQTRALPIILTSTDIARLHLYADILRYRSVPALWMLPMPLDIAAALAIFAQTPGQTVQLEREAP
jgi:CheY-like chemotaxis protein